MNEDQCKRVAKGLDAIAYAKSCVKNRDSRECTTLWLDRAVQQLTNIDTPFNESEFWE